MSAVAGIDPVHV